MQNKELRDNLGVLLLTSHFVYGVDDLCIREWGVKENKYKNRLVERREKVTKTSYNVRHMYIDLLFYIWYNFYRFPKGEQVMETIATSKGQVVIPSKIRKQLGIKDGTYLQIDVNAVTRQIILTPVTREYIHSLRGKYKGKGLMKALMADKKQEREL
ncbi:MAG: AbrB/MazE/SpoVT family DNA-binding domain-containing protein [Anaerolineales bacterium]